MNQIQIFKQIETIKQIEILKQRAAFPMGRFKHTIVFAMGSSMANINFPLQIQIIKHKE